MASREQRALRSKDVENGQIRVFRHIIFQYEINTQESERFIPVKETSHNHSHLLARVSPVEQSRFDHD